MKKLLVLLLLTGCADDLGRINQEINRKPYIEKSHDCRNFAEEKYQALIKRGYKGKDMSFVITDYKGKPHVVLNVNNWILDNNYKNPYLATDKLRKGLDYDFWMKVRGV